MYCKKTLCLNFANFKSMFNIEEVFGKDVRRTSDQSPFMKSTPLVTGRAFAVVFSRMRVRIRCPVLQVSLPEVYNKRLRSMGSQFCSFCLKTHNCVRSSMAERIWADQQSLDRVLSCMSACSKTFFIV